MARCFLPIELVHPIQLVVIGCDFQPGTAGDAGAPADASNPPDLDSGSASGACRPGNLSTSDIKHPGLPDSDPGELLLNQGGGAEVHFDRPGREAMGLAPPPGPFR